MSALLERLEGRERRAECLRNDESMREPVCAGLASERVPGELSSIWCDRCGEGTVAGLCRQNKRSPSPAMRSIREAGDADARDVMRGKQP